MKRLLLLLLCVATLRATTYNSDGSQGDVNAKIALAVTGDTVTVPAGTFTWGAQGTSVSVNKSITLSGADEGSTIINLSPSGPYFGSGVISITAAGAKVYGFTINGVANIAGGPSTTPIAVFNVNQWRVHHITFNGPAAPGYFAYCSAANGLFDHITIHGGHDSLQTFMIRGATSVWNNPQTMGTPNAVYIEDSNFSGNGYMNENDGAACSVLRFNTHSGTFYFDAHQRETSTDASGVQHGSRQIEVYDNTQTDAQYVDWCEFSCGTGMVFDNSVFGSIGRWQIVQEYGAHTGVPLNGSSGTIADPSHPSPDSIGMGKYTAGVQTFGDEPFYFFNNTRTDGTDMQLLGSTVSAAAIAQYGSTFVMTSPEGSPYMLLHGRDYLNGLAHGTFPSTSKVGRGTKAQMLASSPTAARQGWWVTDEASWNTTVAPNTSGQLYQWNGSAWVLYYTPYTYPHPLQTSPTFAPTITVNPISQSVASGANATFIADATGSPTPTWQWSKGGVPIGGATNSTYVITGVVGGDAGNYSATATNSSGSATTTTATLTVTSSPSPATGVPSTPVITGIAP